MEIDKLKKIIHESNNIVFFGGAGVSTASGIPDFRSANGLYSGKKKTSYSPEQILAHTFFIRHSNEFYDFYRTKMIYRNAEPNYAHIALAKLEEAGKLKAVITQNIDGLHQMAGSKNVLELHGSVHRNRCMKCNKYFDLSYIVNSENTPKCDVCGGVVKPEVVLYEEHLDDSVVKASIDYISKAEVFIIGGTSLSVYPASGLVSYYKGNNLILINKTQTPCDNKVDLAIYGNIAEVLNEAVLKY